MPKALKSERQAAASAAHNVPAAELLGSAADSARSGDEDIADVEDDEDDDS